ncbi:MAG: hypothetical protein HC822_21405 [Oscillochloris sp.]|nr:hypothetical protein [Oscillochloris sp.]
MDHLTTAKLLDTYRSQIVDQAVTIALQNPFWIERFGPGFRERLSLDIDLNMAALAKAVRYRSPMIIDDHVRWRRSQIIGFGCSTGHVREIFGYKWAAISALLSAETHATVYDYLQSAMMALEYPTADTRAISAAHDQLATELTNATYDGAWHWQAAYGPDGRDLALRDNWFLIDFAIDSVGAQNPDMLGKHARMHRDACLKRGLSSIHVQQLLWLGTQSAEQLLEPAPSAALQGVFEKAAGYLMYDNEACNALLTAQDGIVGEVAEQLSVAGLAPQPDQAAMEVGWYLAYLNDSMAAGSSTGLVNYARWMQHYFSSQGLPDTPLRQSFVFLTQAVERHLPQYAASAAREMIGAAQRAL